MVALVLVNFFLQGILSTCVTHHTSRCEVLLLKVN